MSRTPGPPVGLPPGIQVFSYAQLCEAAGCPDCVSQVQFTPVHIPIPLGVGTTLFGVFIAHDDTCPALNAARTNQQRPQ